MDEIEIGEGIAEMFEAAENGAAEAAMQEGAEVEANADVQAVADAPAIEGPQSQNAVQNFINNNPYGQKLWAFAKWAGQAGAGATVVFAIMYGLNKAVAQKAHDSGVRQALSDYLVQLEDNWKKNNLPWTDDIRVKAATDALSFPWIDSTK